MIPEGFKEGDEVQAVGLSGNPYRGTIEPDHSNSTRGGYTRVSSNGDVKRCEPESLRLISSPGSIDTNRKKILDDAIGLIHGDRNASYGHPTQNFENTAELWNTFFQHKLSEKFTPEDIAYAMVLLKMARIIAADGQYNEDTHTDVAGYIACAWECVQAGKEDV